MPTFDGVKPKRDYQALQFVWKKRYADRWQALGSFVYSTSSGIGRRSFRQDFNVEGPMFYDDNWMGTLNYTINNLTGLLPFTPQYEFKLSGSYTIPKVDIDVGGRFRTHSGRPFWQQESYPQLTQFGGPDNGVVDPGGLPQIVAVDPKNRSTSRRRPCSISISRSASSSVRSSRSASSSMGSTSSTPSHPPMPIRSTNTAK